MAEKTNKRRRLTGGDRIVAFLALALIVLTLALALLNALNLRLVAGELYVFLPIMLALLLVGWGLSALWRRIRPGAVRKVVAVVMVLGMALLVMVTLFLTSVFAGVNIPRKYAVMTNEGHRLLVMRALDGDQTRIEQRHAARLEADADSNPDLIAEDWGYTYTAYAPAVMGIFYKPDTLLEGAVHIGYNSKAELMVEWEDDVGHFFIKNPEIGDDGEMRAKG